MPIPPYFQGPLGAILGGLFGFYLTKSRFFAIFRSYRVRSSLEGFYRTLDSDFRGVSTQCDPEDIGSHQSFHAKDMINVMTHPTTPTSFDTLGIAPRLLEALTKHHFTTPTPIQGKAIPIALKGKDVIGVAQTGTGKTLAFGIPMIQRLSVVKGRGLIVLPTRELATQVDESLQRIGKQLGLRTAVLIGGASMERQIHALRQNPHIIIATPGRLIDHLEQRVLKLDTVTVLVLDEADRMLDMGFAPQINRILATIPPERQTMLFSATMPAEIVRIASQHMKMPVRVEIAPAGTLSERVSQELFVVSKNEKTDLLIHLLEEYQGTVLVFTRTKFGAKRLTQTVRRMGYSAAEIHSNRSLAQRREALDGFKSGKYRVLVATDIAARGIDVKGIELVVNFDLPDQADDYVHRIGRTGRAGHEGHAISFAMPDQGRDVREIEKLARIHLPISKLPENMKRSPRPPKPEKNQRHGGAPHRGPRAPRGAEPNNDLGIPSELYHEKAVRADVPEPTQPVRDFQPGEFDPFTNSYVRLPSLAYKKQGQRGGRPGRSHGGPHGGFSRQGDRGERGQGERSHGERGRGPRHGGSGFHARGEGKPSYGHGGHSGRGGHGAPSHKKGSSGGKPPFRPKRGPRTFIGGAGIDGTKF